MSQPFDSNTYRAIIIRHIDADTTYARVHLGMDVSVNVTFRWAGINAPELKTDEGKAAAAAVNAWLPAGARCDVQTTKDRREKFGRYLGTFFTSGDPESLNDRLVRLGLAVAYDGGKR